MENEAVIRLGCFLLAAVVLGVLESRLPRLEPPPGHRGRWFGNLGVAVVSSLLVRLLFPVMPAALAIWCDARGVGIMNLMGLGGPVRVVIGVILFDLAIYGQHRLMHSFAPLWRLHRAHHADVFFDFTTALRFHPLEIALSLAYKLFLVLLLGPGLVAVVVFEIVLNVAAMFNHANLALPEGVDAWLRRILVTPDMHRTHHSRDGTEANTNYGFNFPWWDRLFGTYLGEPARGRLGVRIGLNIFRQERFSGLAGILAIPFYAKPPQGGK